MKAIQIHFQFILLISYFILTLTERAEVESKLHFLQELAESSQSLAATSNSTSIGIKCFWLEPNTLSVFDLKGLARPLRQKYDYNFTTASDDLVLYNFCEDILPMCRSTKSQVSAFENKNITGDCTILASQQKSTNEWSLLNPENATQGFQIKLNSGDQCASNKTQNYSIIYEMKCNDNADVKAGTFNLTNAEDFDKSKCENILRFKSKDACPQANFYAIWQFLQKYKIFFGAALIIIGLFEVFLGAKLMIITIFIATCFATITIVFIFLYQFIIPHGAPQSVTWVVLTVSTITGLLLGYLVAKYKKLLIGFILGGYMGYILGLLLYNIVLKYVNDTSIQIYFWITVIGCILVCGLVSYFLVTHILIISTSFCGAYAIIRGISLYAGGFPNESYIMDLIKNGEEEELKKVLTPIVFAYIAGWLVIFIIGLVVQYKTRSDDDDKKSDIDENALYYLKK